MLKRHTSHKYTHNPIVLFVEDHMDNPLRVKLNVLKNSQTVKQPFRSINEAIKLWLIIS